MNYARRFYQGAMSLYPYVAPMYRMARNPRQPRPQTRYPSRVYSVPRAGSVMRPRPNRQKSILVRQGRVFYPPRRNRRRQRKSSNTIVPFATSNSFRGKVSFKGGVLHIQSSAPDGCFADAQTVIPACPLMWGSRGFTLASCFLYMKIKTMVAQWNPYVSVATAGSIVGTFLPTGMLSQAEGVMFTNIVNANGVAGSMWKQYEIVSTIDSDKQFLTLPKTATDLAGSFIFTNMVPVTTPKPLLELEPLPDDPLVLRTVVHSKSKSDSETLSEDEPVKKVKKKKKSVPVLSSLQKKSKLRATGPSDLSGYGTITLIADIELCGDIVLSEAYGSGYSTMIITADTSISWDGTTLHAFYGVVVESSVMSVDIGEFIQSGAAEGGFVPPTSVLHNGIQLSILNACDVGTLQIVVVYLN